MDFVSTQAFDSEGERVLWEAIKVAFKSEPGYCWHRYPITSRSGPRLEPDILILHPAWGLNVIEVKGISIGNIESIEGHIWYMSDWDPEEMEPYDQAQKHMWAILDRLKDFKYGFLRDENGDCKISGRAFVGLPFVTEQEWRQRFDNHISAPKWELIFSNDLEANALRRRLVNAPFKQRPLSEEEWGSTVAIIKGSEAIQKKPRRPTKRKDSRAAWLRQVEQQLAVFDLEQHRVAVEIPSGPQRIRGLAGTGKTVVLAQKAAHMHVKNPEWDIVFTFYSRSLYDQVRAYVTRFVQQFSQDELAEPNWEKLHIWYGWGAQNQPGLYSQICKMVGQSFRTYGDALDYFGTQSGRVAFDRCCQELLNNDIPETFDAILVDEAQDFPLHYFRLCYQALRQPKRIVWGYDEVQSLDELEIPTAEMLFGPDANGDPLVELDGVYPGEIEKDLILYHCYRNPRPVLIAAHTFGLGLLRKGGAVQFIDSKAGWQDIGYEVTVASESKMKAGDVVTLCRPEKNSPHLLEKLAGYRNLVSWKSFKVRQEELEWIVEDVVRNIEQEELKADEIAILALDSRQHVANKEYAILHHALSARGIDSIRLGTDTSKDIFRSDGAVTITSAFRAKGNEASLVYVYGFENVGGNYDAIRRRNRAFTAMTRTRGWLVLTGAGKDADELFQEIEASLETIGCVTFVAPDMAKIERNLETYENQRRRDRVKKVEKSMDELIRNLADVDPNDLSPEQVKQLIRLLSKRIDL